MEKLMKKKKKKTNQNLLVLAAAGADILPCNPLGPFSLREGKKKTPNPSVMALRDFGTLRCLNKWFLFLFQGNW